MNLRQPRTSAKQLAAFCAVLGVAVGCRKAPPSPSTEPPPVPSSAAAVDSSRLPEDAAAGRRATAQWRQHLDQEERERQLGFDGRHLAQHRIAVGLLAQARDSYDRARTATQLAKARTQVSHDVENVKALVRDIDHWGNNSRLLPDYAALETALTGTYPDAKEAALKGNAAALSKEESAFNERLRVISAWLTELEESEEGKGEGERKEGPAKKGEEEKEHEEGKEKGER